MQKRTMIGAAIAVALAALAWPHAASAAGKCWPDYNPSFYSTPGCNYDGVCKSWLAHEGCDVVQYVESAASCGDCIGCTHAVCQQGERFTTGCYASNPIVKATCDLDPYCCNVFWDYMCTIEATQYFGAGCY